MIPYLEVAGTTMAIYLYLVLLVRLLGRRQLGQLSAVDLLILILLGSAVETGMIHGNTSLAAGIVSALTLLLTNFALTKIFLKFKRFRHLVGSGPILLVDNGKFVEEHLKRAGFTEADVLQALRGREEDGLENVRFAVLETDGTVNVIPMHEAIHKSAPVKCDS